jgi:hypothetical protein
MRSDCKGIGYASGIHDTQIDNRPFFGGYEYWCCERRRLRDILHFTPFLQVVEDTVDNGLVFDTNGELFLGDLLILPALRKYK